MALNAVYPGTFDPLTRGHEDLVRRCCALFDQIVVAIAASPKKQPLFPLEQRVAMARAVLDDLPNVEVRGYEGLTVDFATANDIQVIVRGLRVVSDFEFELQLAKMNRHLSDEIETLFMAPSEEFDYVSSSLVREIAEHGGDVSRFVHPHIEASLQAAYARRH